MSIALEATGLLKRSGASRAGVGGDHGRIRADRRTNVSPGAASGPDGVSPGKKALPVTVDIAPCHPVPAVAHLY